MFLSNDRGECFPITTEKKQARTPQTETQTTEHSDCVTVPEQPQGYVNQNNEQSNLTWGESYYMIAYLANYRATQDAKWLGMFVQSVDSVFRNRDDSRDYSFRQPVWSSINYTKGIPHPQIEATGMLTYPIADFIFLIQTNSSLRELKFCDGRLSKEVSSEYLKKIEESVNFHNFQWTPIGAYRETEDSSSYYFTSGTRSPKSLSDYAELPFNRYHALGRTLIRLYQVTKNPEYRIKVEAMAKHFRNTLTLEDNDSYTWPYWAPNPKRAEDLTHGAISVDFARLCHESGIEFSAKDMERFVNTLLKNMRLAEGSISEWVTGEKSLRQEEHIYTALWLTLSPFVPHMKKAIEPLVKNVTGGSGPTEYVSALWKLYGGVIKAGAPCTRDSGCLSHICSTNTCGSQQENKGPCTRHEECKSHFCSQQKKCAPPSPWSPPEQLNLAIDSPCSVHYSCKTGLCKNENCASLTSIGNSCNHSRECQTGICINQKCEGYKPCTPTTGPSPASAPTS